LPKRKWASKWMIFMHDPRVQGFRIEKGRVTSG